MLIIRTVNAFSCGSGAFLSADAFAVASVEHEVSQQKVADSQGMAEGYQHNQNKQHRPLSRFHAASLSNIRFSNVTSCPTRAVCCRRKCSPSICVFPWESCTGSSAHTDWRSCFHRIGWAWHLEPAVPLHRDAWIGPCRAVPERIFHGCHCQRADPRKQWWLLTAHTASHFPRKFVCGLLLKEWE